MRKMLCNDTRSYDVIPTFEDVGYRVENLVFLKSRFDLMSSLVYEGHHLSTDQI